MTKAKFQVPLLLLLVLATAKTTCAFTPTHRVSRVTLKRGTVTSKYKNFYSTKGIAYSSLTRLYDNQIVEADSAREPKPEIPDKVLGILVLLTVPLAWGTYVPVVRYLYAIQPPVPGFVFSACYYALAAITTSSLVRWQQNKADSESPQKVSPGGFPLMGGIELGSYLFIANCLQVIGLRTVESDRAGFLVQFTTVMVPFVEALFAGNLLTVPIRTWIACILAFLGLFVMGLDGKALEDPISALLAAFSSFSQGDFLILGAAVLYTMHVVRLGTYAKETTPMKLAASKATVETFLSIFLLGFLTSLAPLEGSSGLLAFGAETGREIVSFFSKFTNGFASGDIPQSALLQAGGAVLWTGWVTCAYTIYAQSFGQSRVSPTNANLIYTFQPIFTALFAWLLLGETMGPAGVVGGGIIAASVYLVASANMGDSDIEASEMSVNEKLKGDDEVVVEETKDEDLLVEVVESRR